MITAKKRNRQNDGLDGKARSMQMSKLDPSPDLDEQVQYEDCVVCQSDAGILVTDDGRPICVSCEEKGHAGQQGEGVSTYLVILRSEVEVSMVVDAVDEETARDRAFRWSAYPNGISKAFDGADVIWQVIDCKQSELLSIE